MKPVTGDIDRFLEEIDRLRKRKSEARDGSPSEPPVAMPVSKRTPPPMVEPTQKQKRQEPRPVPTAKPRQPRLEELPVAPPLSPPPSPATYRPVVTAQPALAALPKVTSGPVVTKAPGQSNRTAFGNKLVELLSTKESAAMALVLTEILGPPKCKRS